MTPQLAVVTGASSGIGLALARELGGRGCDLVVCAEDDATQMAAAELEALGAAAIAVQADLATRRSVEELVATVRGLGRPVDVLALNAGIGVAGPFVDTPLEDDLRLLGLNISSTVHIAKELLPAMVERGEGRLLVTSSVAAVQPGPWYATYAASKAFLLSFAEALRHELDETGETVTALMPGPTETDSFRRAGMEGTVVKEDVAKDDPADVARDAVKALLAGDDHVVAGSVKNKVQAASKGLPEKVKASMHAAMTRQKD
ncbi:MAG TPA: SDR family NAD(P)-dependent oxidoreductase [Dermatophilaceae bacterium]|nr:SDR family NAD(P)-dependent oxidoreductase [Dermatophilaceae bacterium]